jgi:HAD superfamily hydrolase (TIGR01509 family)
MTYRNIIWDFDGTLFDTYPAFVASFRAALNDLGADASPVHIEELARVSLTACLQTLAAQNGLREEDLDRAFDARYRLVAAEAQPPYPGVAALCAHIADIGGCNAIVTHRGRSSTAALLSAHGFDRYFRVVITSDDGFPMKPNPASFLHVIRQENLRPEETIAVGDRDLDVQAGRAAGIFACRFGQSADGPLADLTVSDFAELLRVVRDTG